MDEARARGLDCPHRRGGECLDPPVVLVAHSLGVPSVIHAIPHFRKRVAGAFLVAPPDVANPEIRPKHLMTFGPYPRDPLPFPSIIGRQPQRSVRHL